MFCLKGFLQGISRTSAVSPVIPWPLSGYHAWILRQFSKEPFNLFWQIVYIAFNRVVVLALIITVSDLRALLVHPGGVMIRG